MMVSGKRYLEVVGGGWEVELVMVRLFIIKQLHSIHDLQEP
jgi:hypothetical protein